MPYRVKAPLVPAKDQDGRIHHYYSGAVIRWLNDQQRESFLRNNLVEEVDAAPAADPVSTEPGEAPAAAGKKPLKAAPVEAWLEYAVSQGLSLEEAKTKNKQELIDALG